MVLSTMTAPLSAELTVMKSLYIKNALRLLVQQFVNSIQSQFNNQMTERLALFIVFDVVICILYFMFWLPVVMKLTRDIWRTRSMLAMIPLDVIKRIRSIKLYIQNFRKEIPSV